MHKTRNEMLKTWPVARKGTKYIVGASHNQSKGIPVLVVLRDILKIAKTRSEAKRIILSEKVKINGKTIKDEKFPLVLFDILNLDSKSYKLVLKNGKFSLEDTKENKKISKIIGKKILKGKKVQINLNDGRNFLTGEKMNVGDSVVYDFQEKKIAKIIPLKDSSEIIVISGSHLGELGKIEKIENGRVEVRLDKEKVSLKLNMLMAI